MKKNFAFVLLLLVVMSINVSGQVRTVKIGSDEIVFTKERILEFQHERKYAGRLVRLTNEGSELAIGYKGGVQVWDTSSHTYQFCLGERNKTYKDIALSTNGRFLVGYRDKTILIWDTAECNLRSSFKVDKDIERGLAVSSNGKYLFYTQDDSGFLRGKREKVVLWDVERGEDIANLQPERLPIYRGGYDPLFDTESLRPATADFSPDSKVLAVQYSFRIYLWDTETGKMIHRFVDNSLDDEMSQGGIYNVKFSHDGSLLVSHGADGTVKVWDVQEKKLRQTFQLKERVHGRASLSIDNKYAAAGGIRGDISIWEVSSGRMLWKGAGKNYFPSFSDPDVGLVSVESGDIYDLRTGEKLDGIKGEFLSDGKLMVKENDGNFSTWRVDRR